MSGYALITPVYLEIALFSGARSGAQAIGQVISAIDIADISIRTLRKEGDAHIAVHPVVPDVISIHALHEEGDPVWLPHAVQLPIFLSTPSARRATAPSVVRQCPLLHFYPRPPRGGRLVQKLHEFFTAHISIHALREEGDVLMGRRGLGIELFLSTPSARRATANLRMRSWWPRYFYPRPPRGGRQVDFSPLQPSKGISIHALREEGDRMATNRP